MRTYRVKNNLRISRITNEERANEWKNGSRVASPVYEEMRYDSSILRFNHALLFVVDLSTRLHPPPPFARNIR